jgi:hypothetical protein
MATQTYSLKKERDGWRVSITGVDANGKVQDVRSLTATVQTPCAF